MTPHRSLVGDVVRMASGTAAAQLLAVAAAPVLTRLYDPAAYGQYAVFLSFTAVTSVLAAGRYELAIMLPADDDEAANVLGLTLVVAMGISLIVGAILWGARAPIAALLESPALDGVLWLLPVFVFSNAVALSLTHWSSRGRQFGRVAVAQAAGALVTLGWQVSAGATGRPTAGMLISGAVAGQAVAAAVLGVTAIARGRHVFAAVTLSGMRAAAARYARFPSLSAPSALMNNISWQTPVFMLSALFTPAVAGLYALGHRLLRLPMSLVGRSLSQVFYQRASVAVREGTLAVLVDRMLEGLMAVFLVPSLLLACVGGPVFSVVFGEEWAESGVFVQILALWTFVWFVSSPLSTIFSTLERQAFDLGLNATILASRVASLALGAWIGGPRLALALFAVSGVLVYGYLIFAIAKAATLPARRVWAVAGGELTRALPWVAPVAAAAVLRLPPLVVLALAAAAGAAHAVRTGTRAYRMTFRHG